MKNIIKKLNNIPLIEKIVKQERLIARYMKDSSNYQRLLKFANHQMYDIKIWELKSHMAHTFKKNGKIDTREIIEYLKWVHLNHCPLDGDVFSPEYRKIPHYNSLFTYADANQMKRLFDTAKIELAGEKSLKVHEVN